MANFKSLQMQFLDDLFWMGGGYVLNFSDRTFAQFFKEEIDIDIDHPRWSVEGGSKGKRMRYFLQTAPQPVVVKALRALWDHREVAIERNGQKEGISDIHKKMANLMHSIGGLWELGKPNQPATSAPAQNVSPEAIAGLMTRYKALLDVAPHQRGYDFERFLRDMFNVYGLVARDPFRIRGEQIDGSFQLEGSTYLLEAKWQNRLVDAAALRAFHGKVEEKAAWRRGLFISYSGFTEDGLFAFGRGKKIICMDARDIHETMAYSIPLDRVISEKARQAASNGVIFRRVCDMLEILGK
ncbi:restriction endonuclease [Mesorhizobium sp. M6A.T.Ce.TU.016.01.1.1]|uniref:restriction endonuclease n=1 Tax=Mesorhizobium sp. M6A.T.Ce.TU.016.01.1.1 TaxID=2496783 RepID=UPI000FCC93FC|nr:restriction endonuclease [Mesorhizobium sp. M6A.T.Ce.TU.016.01.1.1]RUU27310.1 DUF3644 domain-containing protein [Mesorhizobium sp. M6A.T.Ce.TU.016.01.1.1]